MKRPKAVQDKINRFARLKRILNYALDHGVEPDPNVIQEIGILDESLKAQYPEGWNSTLHRKNKEG